MTELKSQLPPNDTRQRTSLSLRAKILLGILLIVFFTIAAMGYFVFDRSQSTNEFLVSQVGVSVNQEIENRLTATVLQEANTINLFFASARSSIELFGDMAGGLVSKDKITIIALSEWNAYERLSQLPNGNWDNSNLEPSSIFIPAQPVIHDNVARELVALKGLDDFALLLLEKNPELVAIYFGSEQGETVHYPNIDLASERPPDFDVTTAPWYTGAIASPDLDTKAAWSIPVQDAALDGLVITGSIPVYDNSNVFRGVAAIDILLNTITQQVSSIRLGEMGYAFLLDQEGRLIAMPSRGYVDFNLTEEEVQSGDVENLSLLNRVSLDVFEILAKMTSGQSGIRLIEINGVNRYIAYKPIPIVGYSFGVVVPEDELLQDFVETNAILEAEARKTLINSLGVIVILLSVAGIASYAIGNSITAPLEKLTRVAEDVARGNLDVRADVTTTDEIGVLGATLNSMTSTTHELITNLESNVAERTKAVERRAAQIQAVAEVGKAVTMQRDFDELLNRTTHLISNRFGYYHVGIFLLDPRGEYAVLRSSNSSGGAKMLAREHKLRVGREGIVGTAASTGEARIALDVGEDAVYFDNPDMPDTRSEIALPLIAGDEILGVLDVQSVEKTAFSEDDIPALQILADQLATAVQNARLLRDTKEALNAAQRAYGDISERGWNTVLQRTKALGFVGTMHGELAPTSYEPDKNTKDKLNRGEIALSADKRTLNAPIVARGQTIGMMRLVKPSHAEIWKLDEIEDIEKLSSQISNALESARLYDEAQRRADFESLSGEIADTIRSSSGIENILHNAIRELGQKLGATRTYVQLNADSTGNGSDKGSTK